ncbi:hypothetical protein BT96DRAFT_917274 [Gymnopus androsaceus JB14]|uniref:MYND-type domain-containing protein n=1 Tax=Gymnopus androsaceus JB14 TaxID=1447944 RepID=A0A6A4I434_9AGAR|nr:hypothetical protein BT96DRAFT_917274 [Gymnopus androsaceus JB14]
MCIQESTNLRRQLLQMDIVGLTIRIIARFACQPASLTDSSAEKDIEDCLSRAFTIVGVCFGFFDYVLGDASIMSVKTALDNDILIHVLRAQRLLDAAEQRTLAIDSSLAGTLEERLFHTIRLFIPYLPYPSVLRRVSRTIESVERLRLLEKYGVKGSASHTRSIGDAWAILCMEQNFNRSMTRGSPDYTYRVCASVNCPHKYSRSSFKLLRCSGCQQTYYCSRACQILDWKQRPEHLSHKVICARIVHDRRACISVPVNAQDLHAASGVVMTRMLVLDERDKRVTELIREYNRSKAPSKFVDDTHCSRTTVQLDFRKYPPKFKVLPFIEVLSLHPEETEHREAMLWGILSTLPSGWTDVFQKAKEEDMTLVYTILPHSLFSRTVLVGPWNLHPR